MSSPETSIWKLLNEIPDPEIPVISVVELGVVRDIRLTNNNVEITITPTYTGCPAMKRMEDDIRSKLNANGFKEISFKMVYKPAWTTDWINDVAKEKLREYGIAPPVEKTNDKSFLSGNPKKIPCPRCKSIQTKLISQFGSTACKALYQCNDCKEPFDYFKCI
jgi:ring-1,2-phenylacetyl-CoA epoxidase subunit PaaD